MLRRVSYKNRRFGRARNKAVTSNRSTRRRNTIYTVLYTKLYMLHYTFVNYIYSIIIYIVFLRSLLLLLVTAKVVPSSPILVILIMEAIRCAETSVLTTSARRHIPEDGILHGAVTLSTRNCYYSEPAI
jgi:hypothetical protein